MLTLTEAIFPVIMVTSFKDNERTLVNKMKLGKKRIVRQDNSDMRPLCALIFNLRILNLNVYNSLWGQNVVLKYSNFFSP